MSSKMKLRSTSSTPTKSTLELNQTSSPTKGSKYKSLLAAILTPSQTKKWLTRKKSIKSEKSFRKDGSGAEVIGQTSDDFCEPTYSTVKELQMEQHQRIILSSPSTNLSENACESPYPLMSDREQISFKSAEEPLYSTINKEKKRRQLDKACQNVNSQNHSYEKTDSECTSDGEVIVLKEENIFGEKSVIKQKDEKIKGLTEENIELHKHIEKIMSDTKWKEESLHSNLKLKITQLENDTQKKVSFLSEQIKVLQKERNILSDQIQNLHEVNKLLQKESEDLYNKSRSMVSPEYMKKKIDEHELFLNQIKKDHLQEVKKLKEEIEVLLESKVTLKNEIEELKEENQVLIDKNKVLRTSEQSILQENSRIMLQLDEFKQTQQEVENLLMSLLKTSEAISIERDVLLNKSSFQDHQQKLLQSTMIDYSLNMGRLQEHICTLSKEKLEEMKKLKMGELQRDESVKRFYEKQLDLLQSKILCQKNVINELQNEKRKLELQLESLWQAVSSEKYQDRDDRWQF